ncbi:MFS transporter [Nesterenkonia sp. HG001]|uniref:MFS transporter n=1 Tax=Nesterenkonia sp. HG001 TaxID=2983207 RepID=UPI002AC4EDA4|nr:MFS transporter [Nesterenkonia sp. HG001]MDZ5078322.1 MFS transporter [Nesterenkonia sp. HG001]
MTAADAPSAGPSRLLLLATVLLVAANLRPAITVVGPLIEQIGVENGISPSALGLLGALPVLSLGVFSPLVHRLSARIGMERSILLGLVVLAGGTVLRSLPGGQMPSGAWTLYLGTAIIGAAIAVGNVLVPAVVKRDFPHQVPLMTGLYTATLVGAAAVASGVAVPLAELVGWELTLGAAALLALATAGIWVRRGPPPPRGALREGPVREGPVRLGRQGLVPVEGRGAEGVTGRSGAGPAGRPGRALLRSPVAWQVTAYFGLQSAVFYVMLTWLPSIQTYQGVTPVVAGWWLSGYQAMGIVASLVVGPLMQRTSDQRVIAVGLSAMMGLGVAGMAFAPELLPIWCLISGFASGATLLVSLTMVSLRARTPQQAARLAGMAQGIGYLVAGLGPLAAGVLVDVAGSWLPVLQVLLVVVGVQGMAGWFAGRRVFVDGAPEEGPAGGPPR